MSRTIGKLLLVMGLLMTGGVVIWGWDNKIFDFSQTGTAIGLRRLFFLLLYFPIPMSVTVVGLVLTLRGWIVKSILVKRAALVISVLLFLFAMSFVVFNTMGNIEHYEGKDVFKVLIINFVFALPILFLSGLLFFISRIAQGD